MLQAVSGRGDVTASGCMHALLLRGSCQFSPTVKLVGMCSAAQGALCSDNLEAWDGGWERKVQ